MVLRFSEPSVQFLIANENIYKLSKGGRKRRGRGGGSRECLIKRFIEEFCGSGISESLYQTSQDGDVDWYKTHQ